MGKKSGYVWVISILLAVLLLDAYYQVQESPIPIWQTSWFMWRMLAVFAIALGIAYYYYVRSAAKRKKELEQFKKKIIEEQENQWKIIAGELHDSIGQNLSAINIFLQQYMRSQDASPDKLEQASELVIETVDEVRRISQRLYPKQIERLGLTISLTAMSERLSAASGIRFDTTVEHIDNVLSRETEVQYFRVVQELLNNILKHSGAKNVRLDVKRSVMFIVTEIEDDGVGFEITSYKNLGFGLINIEERLNMIKAVYEFSSQHGKGTKFKITVPIR